ncbi:MAG: GntR family transcriptional regulator [Mycobacterium sp.]|nr:GntR family transcriptional regulator [Mycobacterium sp.]
MSKPYAIRTALEAILDDLVEGDAFPPERELAARFGVARETVRQALLELLVEGRIERRGRGTTVSKPKLVQPLSLTSYTEGAVRMGRKPGRTLITWEDVEAAADLAEALEVADGTAVMHLERVLLADGQIIGLESTYLPKHRFGHFTETFDPTTSLYAAIRATGVQFGSAVERVETVLASPREAGLLESTTAMPMLRLHRRSLDTEDRPIEVVRGLYRGDRVAFEAMLNHRD